MTRPNYLGIGAIKAGTTWTADSLAAHPDVFMAHGKELHYFSQNYEKGLEWYLGNFSAAKEKAVGEYSVTYMDGSERTAQRIYEFCPQIHLLVSVRDPVERAFSQYRWEKQMGAEFSGFRETLLVRPDLITNGCYAANLAPFWRLFPARQFFYIKHSDIRDNPTQVCRNLYEFLNVDPDYIPKTQDQVIGDTIQPRSRFLENLRIKTHHAAMRYGAARLITLYRQLGLSNVYRSINNNEANVEVLTDADRAELESFFLDDLDKFRSHTGISVVDW